MIKLIDKEIVKPLDNETYSSWLNRLVREINKTIDSINIECEKINNLQKEKTDEV